MFLLINAAPYKVSLHCSTSTLSLVTLQGCSVLGGFTAGSSTIAWSRCGALWLLHVGLKKQSQGAGKGTEISPLLTKRSLKISLFRGTHGISCPCCDLCELQVELQYLQEEGSGGNYFSEKLLKDGSSKPFCLRTSDSNALYSVLHRIKAKH